MSIRSLRGLFSVTLCVASAVLVAPAGARAEDYRVLPNLKVLLDDQTVDLAPAVQDAEAVLVPLDTAVKVLSHGKLSGRVDPKDGVFRAQSGGRVVLEIPVGKAGASETLARVGGRSVPLTDGPETVSLPGQAPRLMMDIKALAGLLGITADMDGTAYSLYTPEFWAGRLGLGTKAQEQRTLRNLPLLPDFGVSPPAKSLLIWVRPRGKTYVQIFKLSGAEPAPLLGEDNFGKRVTQPSPPLGVPKAWPVEAGRPVRVDTRFYDDGDTPPATGPTRWASYVALVSREEPAGGDLAAAIRDGKISGENWCVVGIRQRIARSVVLFEPYPVEATDTIAGIAARFTMPVELLRDLNGLRAGDPLSAGDHLVVIRGIDVGEQAREKEEEDFLPAGIYEVKPGDTVASLAKRCDVAADDLLTANPSLPIGAELEPGELVTLVKPRSPKPPVPDTPKRPDPVQPPPVADVQTDSAVVRTRRAVGLRKFSLASAPVILNLKAGQTLTLLAKIPSRDQCRVSAGDAVGWVRLSDITTAPPADTAPPPLPSPSPGATAAGLAVAREAVRWLGVPRYVWGGNDISRGIDCSHFVAAVYTRARQPVPSPPVHDMEIHGVVVHWKSGPAEQFGRVSSLSKSPSFANLRPGDRIIFQNNPSSGRPGNHHTGIFVGNYNGMRYAVVHCNSSRNTVSVDELTGRLWGIYRYAVRGTQQRPAGGTPFAKAKTVSPLRTTVAWRGKP